jgi:hypothetical protein
MNGAQDLGGMQGFGRVVPDADDSPFHEAWEPRAFALTLAMGATGSWNLDQGRFARESLPPAQYLASTYYRIWFEALVRLNEQRRTHLRGLDPFLKGGVLEQIVGVSVLGKKKQWQVLFLF